MNEIFMEFGRRYRLLALIDDLLNEDHEIVLFIDQFIRDINERPESELRQSLAYIQGTLIDHRVTTFDDEQIFAHSIGFVY